jgi:hypothetical protein
MLFSRPRWLDMVVDRHIDMPVGLDPRQSWYLRPVNETECVGKNACRLVLVAFSVHRSHEQGS